MKVAPGGRSSGDAERPSAAKASKLAEKLAFSEKLNFSPQDNLHFASLG